MKELGERAHWQGVLRAAHEYQGKENNETGLPVSSFLSMPRKEYTYITLKKSQS